MSRAVHVQRRYDTVIFLSMDFSIFGGSHPHANTVGDGAALPVARAAALAEMIEQLETLADMQAVSALLCGDTADRVRKTSFG